MESDDFHVPLILGSYSIIVVNAPNKLKCYQYQEKAYRWVIRLQHVYNF